MAKRTQKLSEYINPSEVLKPFYKPDDFIGVPLVLLGGTKRKGQYGEYYHLDVIIEETGEQMTISTGSVFVRNFMEVYSPSRAGQLRFKFGRSPDDPRMIVMSDPDS